MSKVLAASEQQTIALIMHPSEEIILEVEEELDRPMWNDQQTYSNSQFV